MMDANGDALMMSGDVLKWSSEDVKQWLLIEGFQDFYWVSITACLCSSLNEPSHSLVLTLEEAEDLSHVNLLVSLHSLDHLPMLCRPVTNDGAPSRIFSFRMIIPKKHQF